MRLPGDRDRVRQFAAISLMDLLRRRLLEEGRMTDDDRQERSHQYFAIQTFNAHVGSDRQAGPHRRRRRGDARSGVRVAVALGLRRRPGAARDRRLADRARRVAARLRVDGAVLRRARLRTRASARAGTTGVGRRCSKEWLAPRPPPATPRLRNKYYALAKAAVAAIEEDEDRELIASQLATVPEV